MERQYDRHYAWWKVEFTPERDSSTWLGKTVEVSMKGASFHCATHVATSSRGKIHLFLPPNDLHPSPYELKAEVRVIYSILQGEAGFLTGVDFVDIHEDGATILKITLASCPLVPGEDREIIEKTNHALPQKK